MMGAFLGGAQGRLAANAGGGELGAMSSFGSFLQTHMCQGLLGNPSSLSEL